MALAWVISKASESPGTCWDAAEHSLQDGLTLRAGEVSLPSLQPHATPRLNSTEETAREALVPVLREFTTEWKSTSESTLF